MTDGADRTTSLVEVGHRWHLKLSPGRWRIEVRADRRHRFKVATTVTGPVLYPIPGETDDVRAIRVPDDAWTEEFMRGVTPL